MLFFYHLLDWVFFSIHTFLITGIVVGWTVRRLRPLHLGLCLMTLGAWFGLGWKYGWGYCPLTEWHWRVRLHLGDQDLPWSFVKYLVDTWVGANAPPVWVDWITITAFGLATGLSAILLALDCWRRRTNSEPLQGDLLSKERQGK